VGVFLLKPSDVGNAFCGGRIGSRGCVCVDAVTSCKVAIHQTNKVGSNDVDSNETLILIKKVPAGKGSASVYDSPAIVASSVLEEVLQEFTKDAHTVQSWQTVFQAFSQRMTRGNEPDVLQEITKRTMESSQVSDAITPRKKRIRFKEDTPGMPPEYKSLSAAATLSAQFKADPPSDTGPGVMTVLRDLSAAVLQLEKADKKTWSRLATLKEKVSNDLDALEAKIASDHTLIGERPEGAGTASLWSALENADALNQLLGNKVEDHEGTFAHDIVDHDTAKALVDQQLKDSLKGQLGKSLTSLQQRSK
jgi:hypothetical protein